MNSKIGIFRLVTALTVGVGLYGFSKVPDTTFTHTSNPDLVDTNSNSSYYPDPSDANMLTDEPCPIDTVYLPLPCPSPETVLVVVHDTVFIGDERDGDDYIRWPDDRHGIWPDDGRPDWWYDTTQTEDWNLC